ncbi:MAG: hypothetical protein KAI06_09630, partial [Anaerolineales bacterium]|nr:hypothetical protein [Anaerolineales bacterium]
RPLPEFERIAAAPTTYIEPVPGPMAAPEIIPRRRGIGWIIAALIPVSAIAVFVAVRALGGAASMAVTPTAIDEASTADVETAMAEVSSTATSEPEPSPTSPPLPITSELCPGLALHNPSVDGDSVIWLIDNASPDHYQLENMTPGWLISTNGKALQTRLGEVVLWRGETDGDGELHWIEGVDTTIQSGKSTFITITFQYAAGYTGYTLQLILNDGCVLEGEW